MNTPDAPAAIRIFDTTLRDGEQSPGCSMSPAQKRVMARALADLGVDLIEAGFPASSASDREAMALIAGDLRAPTLVGLSRCNPDDIITSARALEKAHRRRLHLFISTSPLHRQHKLQMSQEEVLQRAAESIQFARQYFDDIEFSAEDATRTETDYLVEVFSAAAAAGATTLNVPDTVGYTTPEEMRELFRTLRARIPRSDQVVFSAHCHNDLGLAVANSLAAIEGGARQVECTVNGIGERAGNCAVEELVMALKVRQPFFNASTHIDSTRLVATSQLLTRMTGMVVQRNKAVVGANAFTHEAGIHQHGMLRHRGTYEIMRPEDVGWSESQLVLGRHSGRHALNQRLRAIGFVLEDGELDSVFAAFKQLMETQRIVTDADLQRLVIGEGASEGGGYRIQRMSVQDHGGRASAQIELSDPDGETVNEHALGDGPVDALFKAMARATGIDLTLESYQVHSIGIGTDARGEASLSATWAEDGVEYSGTGTSRDVIEASALAWLDIANRLLRQRQGEPSTAATA